MRLAKDGNYSIEKITSLISNFILWHPNRKAAIGFIFITLLIDVMGWGLIIPVMPKLISE